MIHKVIKKINKFYILLFLFIHTLIDHLKILSIGCKIFERGKESFGG